MDAKIVLNDPGVGSTVVKGFTPDNFTIRCTRCDSIIDKNNYYGTALINGQPFGYLCNKCSVEFMREQGVAEDILNRVEQEEEHGKID